MGRAFGRIPRELFETMGLNEFQEAHRCIMRSDGLRFREDIVASFYGSRADVDKLQDLVDQLSAGTSPRQTISISDAALPPVTTRTLIDAGFEKVEIDDGPHG